MNLNAFHKANIARQHEAFAPPHPLPALVMCVQEEVGELAAAVLGMTGEKKRKAHLTREDVLDAVADAMTYLSLVAGSVGCDDLEKLLADTFNMVSKRAGSEITVYHEGQEGVMSYREQVDQLSKWRSLQREIHETAKSKGWYDGPRPFAELIALIHSEASEALESFRQDEPAHFNKDGKPEGWGIELADVVIRVLDMCEYNNVDLEALIKVKMAYNKTRPFRHGGKKL